MGEGGFHIYTCCAGTFLIIKTLLREREFWMKSFCCMVSGQQPSLKEMHK